MEDLNNKITGLLVKEWEETKNVNCFLFNEFQKEYPDFFSLRLRRGPASREGFNLKKPFYERIVNKLMSTGKKNGGKKLKVNKVLKTALTTYAKKLDLPLEFFLCLILVKTVPNYGIRRLKYGSGFLTKLVLYTIPRKITWFLKTLIVATNKRNKSFLQSFTDQMDLLFNKSTKSCFLSNKRESEISALRANLA